MERDIKMDMVIGKVRGYFERVWDCYPKLCGSTLPYRGWEPNADLY